ncbi:hypothetical protein [Flavobacterium litorale]|uniref:SIR2-like domain-containing protein n=1 Tax=Flavobacterium litorale TaxID=2856519 RepID=A0ABX8VAS4_9FLAO|nr:hypothetical protein [Flavobacterium litorale]QYJ67721.1 hypothetical protein K1I41_09220 [Flavobacterium litorale]
MTTELINLVEYFNNKNLEELEVITWGSPIISFGNITNSKIATLGINPSNREFVDAQGLELKDDNRRFHTLDSLGIMDWSEITDKHLNKISETCNEYFNRNPYDNWFKKLDYLISGASLSFYFPLYNACHLDLIPYATSRKWSELTTEQRFLLLELGSDFLGNLIKNSEIEYIVLNGQTVVDNFERVTCTKLKRQEMDAWSLKRKNTTDVMGYSYTGYIDRIGNVNLNRQIKVLGYNHNIQSSFGVSNEVLKELRDWLTDNII